MMSYTVAIQSIGPMHLGANHSHLPSLLGTIVHFSQAFSSARKKGNDMIRISSLHIDYCLMF